MCVVTGRNDVSGVETAVATVNAGGGSPTWTAQTVPDNAYLESAISCPSATICATPDWYGTFAGGNSDGTWVADTAAAGLSSVFNMSCIDSQCVEVGYAGLGAIPFS
jgi:hypothetical protein